MFFHRKPSLTINKVASGGLSLILEERVAWETYPRLADKWIRQLKAEVVGEPIITTVEGLWQVKIAGVLYSIGFEGLEQTLELSVQDPKDNESLIAIQQELLA